MRSMAPLSARLTACLSAPAMRPLATLAAYSGEIRAGQTPAPAPAVAATGAAAPQAAGSGSFLPGLPEGSFSWSGYFEALAVLCFGLALLWAALWLVRRFTAGKRLFSSSTPGLRIESRLALGPKKWIFVARYLDRRLVLGVTEQNITLLTEVFPEDDSFGAAEKRDCDATMTSPAASSLPEDESAAAERSAGSGFSPSGAGRTDREEAPADSAFFASLLSKKVKKD